MLTGYNEAFIINGAKKDELIAADPKSAEIIRPILRGRDIKRYEYTFADLWLIATFPSRHYNIDDYPAIKKHLSTFGIEKLEQTGKTHIVNGIMVKSRKKTSNKWFETQDSINYWDDFSKQKIVYREISDAMNAVIIENEIYVNNKCYIITGKTLEHLICVLNSTLFNKIIMKSANLTGGKGKDFFENIKIPKPNNENLLNLYNQLISLPPAKRSEISVAIDNEVYRLYNLTNEEITYITSS